MLITECDYNTEDRDNFTYCNNNFWNWKKKKLKKLTLGGYGTSDEMCSGFFYYYPKVNNMDMCLSQYTFKELYEFHRSLIKYEFKFFVIFI